MGEFKFNPVEVWGQKYYEHQSANITVGAVAAAATGVLWTPTAGFRLRIFRIYVSTEGTANVQFWFNISAVAANLAAVAPDFVLHATTVATAITEDIVVDLSGTANQSLHYACPNNTFIMVHGEQYL